MIDEPDPEVLLEAMGRCLADSVAPELSGTPRYHTLVVANLCSILARQWRLGPGHRSATIDELKALLAHPAMSTEDQAEGNRKIKPTDESELVVLVAALDRLLAGNGTEAHRVTTARRIGSIGSVHPGNDSLLPVLRADVERRLAVNRPGYDIDRTASGHSGAEGTMAQ